MRERFGARLALIIVAVALLLSACAPKRAVRVDPQPRPPTTVAEPARVDEYVVVRGDTLYGIAFRNSLDYRELARLNSIVAPYTIYPGQRLKLRIGSAASAPPAQAAPRTPPPLSNQRGVVASVIAPRGAAPNTTNAPTPTATSPATLPKPTPTANSSATAPTTPPPPAPSASLPNGPVQWRWPAPGKLIGTFLGGDPTRQGINIAGDAGQLVQAAADGVVVYSGSGLIGYGELIIVKHSDALLSAYGHNRKRLVAEGEAVKAGQTIAEMGRSGASRDMLHFEVRRNGKPIDPLTVLPKR